MCTYNISLNDDLVMQARQSFSSESLMTSWIQQQVETLLKEFNERQQTVRMNARNAIDAMRKESEMNGNSNLTLDEINKEIRLARKSRKASV